MFDNLTMEIIYFSVIPVAILAIITLIIFYLSRKSNYAYRYSYLIRILEIIMISLVLPLGIGYTIWYILRYIVNGITVLRVIYAIILCLLNVALITLLTIICRKIYKSIENKERVS